MNFLAHECTVSHSNRTNRRLSLPKLIGISPFVAYWLASAGLVLSGLVSAIETALVGVPDRSPEAAGAATSIVSHFARASATVRTHLHVFRIVGGFAYAVAVIVIIFSRPDEAWFGFFLVPPLFWQCGSNIGTTSGKRNVLVWATFGMSFVQLLRFIGFPLVLPVQLLSRLFARASEKRQQPILLDPR